MKEKITDDQLIKIFIKFLGKNWMSKVINTMEEPLGELKDIMPSWYSPDYYFRPDVICENLWETVKKELKQEDDEN